MPSDNSAIGEFSVSENYPAPTATSLVVTDIKLGDGDCAEDFVTIPQGSLASTKDSQSKDRYLQMFHPH